MNCTVCHQPVTLHPSAAERAAKYGGSASDYVRLFPMHADCVIRERSKPMKDKRVNELPATFQELEMLRLRQMELRCYGKHSGYRPHVDKINKLTEAELRQLLEP